MRGIDNVRRVVLTPVWRLLACLGLDKDQGVCINGVNGFGEAIGERAIVVLRKIHCAPIDLREVIGAQQMGRPSHVAIPYAMLTPDAIAAFAPRASPLPFRHPRAVACD